MLAKPKPSSSGQQVIRPSSPARDESIPLPTGSLQLTSVHQMPSAPTHPVAVGDRAKITNPPIYANPVAHYPQAPQKPVTITNEEKPEARLSQKTHIAHHENPLPEHALQKHPQRKSWEILELPSTDIPSEVIKTQNPYPSVPEISHGPIGGTYIEPSAPPMPSPKVGSFFPEVPTHPILAPEPTNQAFSGLANQKKATTTPQATTTNFQPSLPPDKDNEYRNSAAKCRKLAKDIEEIRMGRISNTDQKSLTSLTHSRDAYLEAARCLEEACKPDWTGETMHIKAYISYLGKSSKLEIASQNYIKAAHFFKLHGLKQELQGQHLSVNEVKAHYYLSNARVYETDKQAGKDYSLVQFLNEYKERKIGALESLCADAFEFQQQIDALKREGGNEKQLLECHVALQKAHGYYSTALQHLKVFDPKVKNFNIEALTEYEAKYLYPDTRFVDAGYLALQSAQVALLDDSERENSQYLLRKAEVYAIEGKDAGAKYSLAQYKIEKSRAEAQKARLAKQNAQLEENRQINQSMQGRRGI